jgi:hypothetical protein
MINHYSDFTAFIILLYSAIAFLSSGTIKIFSEKVHNALFKKVFVKEQMLRSEKEQLESQLTEINVKLERLNH